MNLFSIRGTWHVTHADGTREDIVLGHGDLVEDNKGTVGQFMIDDSGLIDEEDKLSGVRAVLDSEWPDDEAWEDDAARRLEEIRAVLDRS